MNTLRANGFRMTIAMPLPLIPSHTGEGKKCVRSFSLRENTRPFFTTSIMCLFIMTSAFAQTARIDTLQELMRRVEILTEEIEKMKLGEVADVRYEPGHGLGPAGARVYQLQKTGVSLAGYGEIVYENFSKNRDDGQPASKPDQIDFLRNVVYVGFRFNDWILFNSEIEFEHASTGKGGEVSVEFGYLDLMISTGVNIRAGMVLLPLGIINEKHEPTTFFGTLRPEVERFVIPSTWRAVGVGVYGEAFPSFRYRAYLIEGLNAKSFSELNGIRGGRQSGARALAEDFAFAGRLEYDGLLDAILGISVYAGNSGQGAVDSRGTIRALTTIYSVHGEYAYRGLELRGLYGRTAIDDADRVSQFAGRTILSSMEGWYVTAGYDIMPLIVSGTRHYFAPFIQYEKFHARHAPNTIFGDTERFIFTAGVMYKPHPNVGFKFDYRDNKNDANTDVNQWNLGISYLF